MTARLIGIDFDNTIVDYEALFATLAIEGGLFDAPFAGSRIELRAHLRARPGGELQWQRLQAQAYGPRIADARLHRGVLAFIDRAQASGHRVHIVSHKTERAAASPDGPSLREAAVGFMRRHAILGPGRLERDAISFASTRAEKLAMIGELACTDFIDDLVEVLEDPAFPPGARPVLFAPTGAETRLEVATSWARLAEVLLP